MSQYADLDDLEQLGISHRALESTLPEDRIRALVVASSEADTYIPSKYKPLTVRPDALRMHVARAAVYIIMTTRGMNPNSAGNELIVKGYDDAISYFKNIQRGIVTFPRDQAVPDVATGPAVIQGASGRGLDYL